MDFCLVKLALSPSDRKSFDDVMLPFFYALQRLGYTTEIRINHVNPESINILFGCNGVHLNIEGLPSNTVIFNLEQLATPDSPWDNDAYRELLQRFTVWEYSKRNARYLQRDLDVKNVRHIPLGYVPEMTRLKPSFPQDTDVLFYGNLNPRRRKKLEEIKNSGLRLLFLQSMYGGERDYAIARSKLIVNLHYYSPAILEVPRLGYLWANRKCVVSERAPETEIPAGLEDACVYSAYDDIVATLQKLARDKQAREEQAEAGFNAFSAQKQEYFLEAVVGRKSHHLSSPPPTRIQAGSGKDFRHGFLNIDINPQMNPDLVLDLSQPLEPAKQYETARFGTIRLMPGSFDYIVANDVLEHVEDVIQTMSNFLELLKEGGTLELSVPYDLSLGAWQDPTHRRGFNEMSWIYYCEWAWYIGWKNSRFSVRSLFYGLSDYGQQLQKEGQQVADLLRTPRAVDSMRVVLVKRKSTSKEIAEYYRLTREFYHEAAGDWSLE